MLRPIFASLLTFTLASPAFAGSQTIACHTKDKSISMAAGNSESEHDQGEGVLFKYVDESNKPATFTVGINLMPTFSGNADRNKPYLIAIPTNNQQIVSEKSEVMHVFHKDGTDCFGRERWNTVYVQSYVFTGKDGDTATSILPSSKKMPGLTKDGYIAAEFICRDYGITTAGGCFVGDGDTYRWEKNNSN
ncbi:MAG TPA: hypothetical protein VIH99_09655 [Bdellovibrionota bacterium]|jgi:hypothetical protein